MSLPTPTLHTARLRLRPFDDADADDIFALQSNASVLRYWDAPPWTERTRADATFRVSASAWTRLRSSVLKAHRSNAPAASVA